MNSKDRKKFEEFGNAIKNLKGNFVPDSHWEKESKIIRKRMDSNKRIYSSIRMSENKFRECFTI